jgi:tetratricopeptide (TPR) repeat protein
MAYHHGSYNNWYHGDWHDHYHWDHPWHYGPAGWWSVGFVTGGLVVGAAMWDAPWRWGYWPYYNPYYTEVIFVDNTPIDYSRPIVVAAPPAAAETPPGAQAAPDVQAEQLLDAARDAFMRGDYATAMTRVNQAVAQKPNDTVPHEFRALVLFANKQYKEAAATVYAVLSVGPGWDWATLCRFYPDVSVYSGQLRALEQYRNEHLKSPEVRFLLAYHYMCCGHSEAAVAELKEVVRLSPKDQLSAQLLAALTQDKPGIAPAPIAAPPAPAKPVAAASLLGNWTASRPDGSSFALEIAKDGTYSWTYTVQGKSQTFSGAYTVADNLLILKEGGAPKMIGQVVLVGDSQFNFKLVGDNASDSGLAFTKK